MKMTTTENFYNQNNLENITISYPNLKPQHWPENDLALLLIIGGYVIAVMSIITVVMFVEAKFCFSKKIKFASYEKLQYPQLVCIPMLCRIGVKNGKKYQLAVNLDV